MRCQQEEEKRESKSVRTSMKDLVSLSKLPFKSASSATWVEQNADQIVKQYPRCRHFFSLIQIELALPFGKH
jgi:hypothetical protein